MIGTESKWGKNSAYITGYEKTDMGRLLQKNLEGTNSNFILIHIRSKIYFTGRITPHLHDRVFLRIRYRLQKWIMSRIITA